MSKKTILLITESTLGRFDLAGGSKLKVTESWVRPSFGAQSAGTLVDAALRLGKSRNRQVIVLTSRCWTGPVAIGPELISGAAGDELLQMVVLEAETYSGLSAFESSANIVSLPPDSLGNQQFWLTQIEDQELRSIDDALQQAGAKLIGVGHPAVSTLQVSESGNKAWQTLQNWDESTLLIRGSGETIADFHSMSSGLQSQRTIQEFESFFQGLENDTALQWIGIGQLPPSLAELPQAENYQRSDVTAESDLRNWVLAWMGSQSRQSIKSPLITIPKRPMSKEVGFAIAAILGLLMIGLCFAHYWYTSSELADITENVEVLTERQEQLKADQKKLEQLEKNKDAAVTRNQELLAAVQQSKADVAKARTIIERSGRRWLSLVDSLIEVSDTNSWIREIRSTDDSVVILGFATDDSIVHRLAAQLESTSLANFWQILPATTKVDPDSRLIDFTINLIAYGSERNGTAGSTLTSSRASGRK